MECQETFMEYQEAANLETLKECQWAWQDTKKPTGNFKKTKKVESNTKKRFTLIDRAPPDTAYNLYYIKANQGHTMKIVDDDALLTEIKEGELEVCCHGTFERLWFWKK